MSSPPEFHTSMESAEKLELLHEAIQKILAEKSNKEEDHQLLCRLLSELELLKEDGLEVPDGSAEQEASNDIADEGMNKRKETDNGNTEGGAEEMVKELRKVKRQNLITHCLLSAMIILTVTWQLSEVSLLLRLKDGLSHPFKSFGSMLTGMMKGRAIGGPAASDKPDNEEHQMEIPSFPIKIPEFPHMDSDNKS